MFFHVRMVYLFIWLYKAAWMLGITSVRLNQKSNNRKKNSMYVYMSVVFINIYVIMRLFNRELRLHINFSVLLLVFNHTKLPTCFYTSFHFPWWYIWIFAQTQIHFFLNCWCSFCRCYSFLMQSELVTHSHSNAFCVWRTKLAFWDWFWSSLMTTTVTVNFVLHTSIFALFLWYVRIVGIYKFI